MTQSTISTEIERLSKIEEQILGKTQSLQESDPNYLLKARALESGLFAVLSRINSLEEEINGPKKQNKGNWLTKPAKAIASAGTIILSAIAGAGIAKELMPQSVLDDIVQPHSSNNEDTDYYAGKHIANEPEFNEGGDYNTLSQASIVGMNPVDITMGGGAIDFSEADVRVVIENDSLWEVHGLYGALKWDTGDTSNLSFSKVSDDLYKVEFDTKIQADEWFRQENRSINKFDTGIEEYIGVDQISSNKIVFERVWYDIDNETVLNSTLEEINVGDQIQLHGGTNVTLDSISQNQRGELVGNFSGRQEWYLTKDELSDGNIDLDIDLNFEGENHELDADFRSGNSWNQSSQQLEPSFRLDIEGDVYYETFQLPLGETKVLEGNSMNNITVTREYSQDSDFNYQLNIEFTTVFGEQREGKMWFNHSYDEDGRGQVTSWKGDIPGLSVRMYDDHSFSVTPHSDLNINFDKNIDITTKSLYGNEADSQRFFDGSEPLVIHRGSIINKTDNQNQLTLGINSADLDLYSPSVNGIIFEKHNSEYLFGFEARDRNLKNVGMTLTQNDSAVPSQSIYTEFSTEGDEGIAAITIPKESLTEGKYSLNISAEDDVGNLIELSKRVVVASLGDVSLQSLITTYDSEDNRLIAYGQIDGSSANNSLEFIVENETGGVVLSKTFFSNELGNDFVISEEVNLSGGRYTAKLQTNKTEHTVITKSHIRAPFTYGPNATKIIEYDESPNNNQDFEPHSMPEITINSIESNQGIVGNYLTVEGNASELVKIVADIDGVEYNFTNLVPRDEQNESFHNRNNRVENIIYQTGQISDLVGVKQVREGVFIGFTYERSHNPRTNETIFRPTPHVWFIDEHQISSASEKPFIGISAPDTGWGNWKKGIRPVEVLPDSSILVEKINGITWGDDYGNLFEPHASSLTVVNSGEIFSTGVNYQLVGSRNQITETLESKFEVYTPPVIPKPEIPPIDNNTNDTTNESAQEYNSNNTNNDNNTNETELEQIAWSTRLDIMPSYLNCGNPEKQFEGASLIFYRENSEDNITQYVLQRLDTNTIANIDSEKIENSEYTNERFRSLLSNSNVTAKTEFSVFGIYQDGSKTPTINIGLDGSCYSPLKTEEDVVDNPDLSGEDTSLTGIAPYVAGGLVLAGGLPIAWNGIQRRREKQTLKERGKWDVTEEVNKEIEESFNSESYESNSNN
tara:strand:- start:6860 stop:10456 length:3597 start_codon:yes stop_codon:yes gene_type:complete